MHLQLSIVENRLQLTFSQGFSLWAVNVEKDGSITPDKAIVG